MSDLPSSATPRRPRWQNLSARHASVQEELQTALTAYCQGRSVQVKAVVGPYGSGKSELLAWGFHYCWTELEIPAINMNLETLLRLLPEKMNPMDLVDAVNRILNDDLSALHKTITNPGTETGYYLAPDFKPDESLMEYFKSLFDDDGLAKERILRIVEKRRCVLFLDEIEQKYREFNQRVETSDQAPLRELLQSIEQGISPYYIVMSFGLTSAYESMSGADIRRVKELLLPIPEARDLAALSGNQTNQNLLWWASRGRPGWAIKFSQSWEEIEAIHSLEEYQQLISSTIESLPVIDTNTISSVFADHLANRVITTLIKTIAPQPIKEFKSDVANASELMHHLRPHNYMVASKPDRLVAVSSLADWIMQDLLKLAEDLAGANIDWNLLRYYLVKILSAMASPDGKIVFGGWRDKNEWFAKAAMAPILILLQDMQLEFEGDRANNNISFLDQVMEKCTIVGEKVIEKYEVVRRFESTAQHFEEVSDLGLDAYICLSPLVIEALFPRIVSRPLLNLQKDALSTISNQKTALQASISASGQFLEVIKTVDGRDVTFILLPGSSCVHKLQEKYFLRNLLPKYMAGNRIFVILTLEENHPLEFDFSSNSDLRALQELKKVSFRSLGEKRLQDFVVSLWHNWTVKPVGNGSISSFNDVLREYLGDQGLSKTNRRKLEYYRTRLDEKLNDLAADFTRVYQRELRSHFDPEDRDFPNDRLNSTFERVKENRTIEEVALAIDAEINPQSLLPVGDLRQLGLLRKLTKQPHAYDEFLDTYTVVKQAKEAQPAKPLEVIINYIRFRSGFAKLLGLARRLGINPTDTWEDAKTLTEVSPLLRLYSDISVQQKLFLQGISLHGYLKDSTKSIIDQLEVLQRYAQARLEKLQTLEKEIKDLNRSLDYDLLTTSDIKAYIEEIEKLISILSQIREFQPSVLYILYRFSESALDVLDERIQRWQSDHGISGWKSNFQKLRGWKDNLKDLTEQVSGWFGENALLKESILGKQETVITRLQSDVRRSARKALDSLDKDNKLTEALVLEPDLDDFEQALESMTEKIENFAEDAGKIDQICADLEKVHLEATLLLDNLGRVL